jgi:hypothetical protein
MAVDTRISINIVVPAEVVQRRPSTSMNEHSGLPSTTCIPAVATRS